MPPIVPVADKKAYNIFEENPELLIWYDETVKRTGGE